MTLGWFRLILAARILICGLMASLQAAVGAGSVCPAAGRNVSPIVEIKHNARSLEAGGSEVTVCGQVTMRPGELPDDPDNFYIQDSTGGISVVKKNCPRMSYGQWILVKGNVRLFRTGETEIRAEESEFAGPGRMPAARRVSLNDVNQGKVDGWHVTVAGVVTKLSRSGTRDDLVLSAGGVTGEAYTRRRDGVEMPVEDIVEIGSRVEVSGVAIPTESAAASRVRFRSRQDILLVERPPFFTTKNGRGLLAASLLAALISGLWILALRGSVRRQTAEIRALLHKAEEASRLKSEFLANISHEIRTPLHGVIGLQKMALDEPVPERPRHYLELANQASTHLLALLSDLHDLAAIDKGAIGISEEPMSPGETLKEACGMFAAAAASKGLRLEARDLGLPCKVTGDPIRLKQVLVNLVNNAVKFTPAGSVTVAGRSERVQSGWRLKFAIEDTGIGMPAEQQKHIFEEFRQADGSIRRRYGGTGLGLALCSRLVGLMGGAISVHSQPGKGSVFSFELLCGEVRQQEAEAGVRTDGPRPTSQLKLLLVEDNRLNQMVATSFLLKDGHSVEVAENGLQALAAYSRASYDAILMDLQMPLMDGLTAAKEIRSRESAGSRVPILALTAHTHGEDRDALADAGVDAVLSKPFSPDQLREALSRIQRAGSCAGRPRMPCPKPGFAGSH